MSIAYVDVQWGLQSTSEESKKDTGWLRYSGPRDYPSPNFLRKAKAHSRTEDVTFYYLEHGQIEALPTERTRQLLGHEHFVISSPSIHGAASETLEKSLVGCGVVPSSIQRYNPWQPEAQPEEDSPGYELTRQQTTALAEIDTAPFRVPVHPWASPTLVRHETKGWEQRLEEAVASFAPTDPALMERPIWQAWERDLVVNDHRIPLNMDRVSALARLVSKGLKEHSTMLKLHLNVSPRDILENERVAKHLPLLPVGSLNLLVGSMSQKKGFAGSCPLQDTVHACRILAETGITHLTSLSVVLGLPGESAEDCLEVIQLASKTALEAKIRHVRFALWPGEEKSVPENVEQMQELFLANHPSWHPVEYRGIHDFLALMNETLQHTKVVGPEFSPDWNETEAVIPD